MKKTSDHKWSLIGIPDHQAVMNLGGRVGAAKGPQAFRYAWSRLSGRDRVRETCRDHGDAQHLGINIAENHTLASKAILAAHSDSPLGLSVVVGGAHDHGFSHLRGIAQGLGRKTRLGCINIDAHLDCRAPDPEISSGSPFYLSTEEGVVNPTDLVEFGIQRHCNGPDLWNYAEKKGFRIHLYDEMRGGRGAEAFKSALTELTQRCDAVVVSFDIDAVEGAHAPGVSAPPVEGFAPWEIMDMMRTAGEDKKVVSLGLFELNPEHDVDARTARLAATAAYHFVAARLS